MAIGLYIHVPFCLKKCNYCDFVSYPYDAELAASYLSALKKEMELYSASLEEPHRTIDSIYIGGGTPTVLAVHHLEELFNCVARNFTWPRGIEITVEANPGTLTEDKVSLLQAGGCNRLSIGVQSINEETLICLGRAHNRRHVEQAVEMARKKGFTNVNVDLIFGVPGQSFDHWQEALRWAARLKVEHISAYSLKVEAGTPFKQMVETGTLILPDEEEELNMYLYAIDALAEAGYEHYELSNFCLPGKQSHHNLRYWANEEYLGLGPAAHSYLKDERFFNYSSIERYALALQSGKIPVAERHIVSRKEEIEETVFLGLRRTRGLELKCFQGRFGESLEELFPKALDKLEKLGLIQMEKGFIKLTRRGLPLANEVFVEFI